MKEFCDRCRRKISWGKHRPINIGVNIRMSRSDVVDFYVCSECADDVFSFINNHGSTSEAKGVTE